MAQTIPASQLVNVNPGVVGTGGSPLSMAAIFLTNNVNASVGSATPFASQAAVATFFGSTSPEAQAASRYFLGFDNSTIKPGNLYFAQYPAAAVAAFLRGGSMAAITLTTLKTYSGLLTLTVDGVVKNSTAITLSAATSFSNAATIITAAFTGVTVTFDALSQSFKVASPTTGAASTITACTGTLADLLMLSTTTGAIVSNGAVAGTPLAVMDALAATTRNWVTFTTLFEPIAADEDAFRDWANTQNQRYLYVNWDTDITTTQPLNATSFAAKAKAAAVNGTISFYTPLTMAVNGYLPQDSATAFCGMVASIDFTRTNGRHTFAFRTQSGLVTTITDGSLTANLKQNGSNWYGAYSEGNNDFNLVYPGQLPGQWKWADEYIGQIRLNSQLRLALLNLLVTANSIPYNEDGYNLIRAACNDAIQEALNFGTIRTGVALSQAQAAKVNMDAGVVISGTLATSGYYLQVLDATAQTRGNRESPPITLWYMSGGAVQSITMASIDVL